MNLLGQLAKLQGLKGEFLLNPATEAPERIPELEGLMLAPPWLDLAKQDTNSGAMHVSVRSFRMHQGRPCLSFAQMIDRTAAEPYKDWSLWGPILPNMLEDGETFRRDWVGCQVFVAGVLVGEVVELQPSPGGYDMVRMRDLRPGRHGTRNVPYIKAWFTLDLANHRIGLDPPDGLLDVD
jgi:16S rRNA processing protein RimM